MTRLGYAAIGLCGVSCWSAPRKLDENGDKIGERVLHPDFAGIKLDGRTVLICFDADILSKPQVGYEEFQLAVQLEKAGDRSPLYPHSGRSGLRKNRNR